MARFLTLLAALPLLFFVPGRLCIRLLGRRGLMPAVADHAEGLFLAVLTSVAAVSWSGLILAETGYFSLAAVLVLLAAICLVLAALTPARRRKGATAIKADGESAKQRGGETALILLYGCLALVMYAPPYEYVLGNWDPGTFVNSAAHLANEGSILIHDQVLAALAPPDRELFYYTHLIPQRYEGGMAIADGGRALVSPHFYHVYTVWVALFHSLGGVRFSLWMNVVFGLLALAAFALACRELGGRRTALFAALLLTASAAEIWSVKFPTGEIAAQFFFFSGLFCLLRFRRDERGFWGLMAGVCFAEYFLTVFTAVLLAPLLLLLAAWRTWDRWRRSEALFLVPLAAGLAHLILQDATVCRSYTDRQLEVLRAQGLTRAVILSSAALFAAGLAAARALLRGAKERVRMILSAPASRVALGTLLAGLFLFAYRFRPLLEGGADARNLRELGWFVYPLAAAGFYFPLGLCLSLLGALFFIGEGPGRGRWSFLLIVLPLSCFFITRKMIFPSYLWAMRRFTPVIFPSLILLMSYPLARLSERGRRGGAAASAVVMLLAACMQIVYARRVLPTDYAGTVDFLERLASPLDRGGLYVCEGSGIASPLDYIFGLDVLQLSSQTPEKCRRVEAVLRGLIARGRRVYYVSRGGWPISQTLDFAPLSAAPLATDHLEFSVGAFPRQRVPLEVTARVFRVLPLGEPPGRGEEGRLIEIGEDSFGLLRGFRGVTMRREGRGGRGGATFARWTEGEAEMVIPTLGSRGDIILAIRATAGRDRPGGAVPVRLFIGEKEVGEIRVGRRMEDHTVTVPAAALPPGSRAVLRLSSPVWNMGGGGAPGEVGIFVDSVRVGRGAGGTVTRP